MTTSAKTNEAEALLEKSVDRMTDDERAMALRILQERQRALEPQSSGKIAPEAQVRVTVPLAAGGYVYTVGDQSFHGPTVMRYDQWCDLARLIQENRLVDGRRMSGKRNLRVDSPEEDPLRNLPPLPTFEVVA